MAGILALVDANVLLYAASTDAIYQFYRFSFPMRLSANRSTNSFAVEFTNNTSGGNTLNKPGC